MTSSTGQTQQHSQLWSAAPRDWADNELLCTPVYEAVFDAVDVGKGVRLLDIGSGAGTALRIAAARGATVAGIDAADGLVAVAREQVPDADIRLGDLASLPFADGSFDVVTSFNAVQYAADPVAALREAARTTVHSGRVVIATWGGPQRCESRFAMAALRDLMPPPPGAGGPFALSAPGKLEELAEAAGLSPERVDDAPVTFTYPDLDTAIRIQLASGPARRTMAAVGEAACWHALSGALAASRRDDGSYQQANVFRYLVARV